MKLSESNRAPGYLFRYQVPPKSLSPARRRVGARTRHSTAVDGVGGGGGGSSLPTEVERYVSSHPHHLYSSGSGGEARPCVAEEFAAVAPNARCRCRRTTSCSQRSRDAGDDPVIAHITALLSTLLFSLYLLSSTSTVPVESKVKTQ